VGDSEDYFLLVCCVMWYVVPYGMLCHMVCCAMWYGRHY